MFNYRCRTNAIAVIIGPLISLIGFFLPVYSTTGQHEFHPPNNITAAYSCQLKGTVFLFRPNQYEVVENSCSRWNESIVGSGTCKEQTFLNNGPNRFVHFGILETGWIMIN